MGVLGEAFSWLTDATNYSGDTGIPARLYEHFLMSSQAVLLAAIVALPIGMYIGHRRRVEFLAVSVGNLGRALPSFGILGLVFPFTLNLPGEIGFWATFIALFLLAIPPILTNSYVGVKGVDEDVVEAARGMGMTGGEVLFKIETPLATPLIVGGLRTASVQVVATATLGAVAGWGGLGRFIIDGNNQGDDAQLLGGAILVALFAIVTEVAFATLERIVVPKQASARKRAFSIRRPVWF